MKIQPLPILICLTSAIFAAYPISYKAEARILDRKQQEDFSTGLGTYFIGQTNPSTLFDKANSLFILKSIYPSKMDITNVEGASVCILSIEDSNPVIAEKNIHQVFSLLEREMGKRVAWIDSTPATPCIPWWRSALALGMLLLFTLTAKPSRR